MLVLTLLALAAAQKAGQENVMCFDDGIPAGDRRFLDGLTGDLPFSLTTYGRVLEHPNAFFSDVMLILFREKLGVHAYLADQVIPGPNGEPKSLNSNMGLRTLAGCTTIDDPACNDRDASYRGEFGHLFIGFWKSYGGAVSEFTDSPRFTTKECGGHGYDGMFVKETSIDRAKGEGLDLKWVGNYNVAGAKAKQYFMNTLADLSHLSPIDCTPLTYMQDSYVDVYKAVSGDVSGGAEACEDNWWISAGCRADKTQCIPIITTGDGWSIPMFMQYSYFYGVPLAIGTLDWSEYVIAGQTDDVMLYWWYPDMTFARDLPMRVQGMPANTGEQAKGIWSTANQYDTIMNALYEPLQEIDPKAWELANNLYLDDFDMQKAIDLFIEVDILRHQDDGGAGNDGLLPERYQLACRWLKENEELWADWVPDKKDCRDTEGVVIIGTNAMCVECTGDVVSVVGPDGYRICDLCPAGTVDLAGVCEPCAMGSYNPEAGADACVACPAGFRGKDRGAFPNSAVSEAEGCEPCPDGTYTNEDGHCTPCHRGTFNAVQGAESCEACPPGTYGLFAGAVSNASCLDCAAGTYATQPGTAVCPVCLAGTFSTGEGMAECQDCAAGTYSVAQDDGLQECVVCPAGKFCAEGKTPVPCEAGHFAEAGSDSCLRCPARTYQDEESATVCKPCQPDFTSPPGSTVIEDCVCPQGFFYSANKDKCMECLDGMVCLQGKAIPFVEAGLYAEAKYAEFEGRYVLEDGKWQYSSTKPEDGKWQYSSTKPGAPEQLFSDVLVWTCPYGEIACPGRSIDAGNGFIAKNARKMDECSGNLFKNGCSRCPSNFYFSRDDAACMECTGGDTALYPILYMLGLGAMVFLYKITKFRASQKLTNMLMFSCSASLLLNFFQMLGVIGFYAAEFPAFLEGFFDFFKLFVFDLDVLRASCATGSDFHSRFLTRTVSPLVFILSFLALYPVSVVASKFVPKVEPMDRLNLLNASGLIINAGYIALCKIAMQYYECKHQPSAPATVAAYPDIDCGSAEHTSMMPLAVIFTMLYGAGIYIVCLYLCFIAPKKMIESQDFRRKTRFLVGRWNPGRWYWGPVLQTRNLLVSLVVVFYPSDGMMQFLLTGALVVIYTVSQSTMEPWRDLFLNITDSVLGLCITLTCMFGVLLVQDTGGADTRSENAQAYLAAIFTIAFIALGYAVGQAISALAMPKKSLAKDAKYTREAVKIMLLQTKKLSQLCTQGATEDDLALALSSYLTHGEQRQIFKLGKVLLHELCGVTYKSEVEFRRLMINASPADVIELESVNMDLITTDDKGESITTLKNNRVSAMSKLGGNFR